MSVTALPLAPLLSPDQIRQRVAELAVEIETVTPPEVTIHLVGMLTGGFMFLADLARAFSRPITIDFVRCSSYGVDRLAADTIVWTLEPHDVHGKHVLIVEDIVDTGATLHALRERLLTQRPQALRSVCLLDKPARRRWPVPVDFVGFTVEDFFVVGYGLDHAEQYRHLPFIAVLSDP